ncbi:MAG: hypothetical protein ACOYN5_10995 [Bacteroidales bacterium]
MTDLQLYKNGLKQRVFEWFERMTEVGGKQIELAEKWKVSTQYVSKLSKKKESVGLEVIIRIMQTDDKIDARWLILGVGKMYPGDYKLNQDEDFTGNINNSEKTLDNKSALQKIISNYERERNQLIGQIDFLKHIIEEKL